MPRQPLHGSGTKAGTHLSRSVLRHGARGLARHTSLAQKAALSVIDKALVSTGVLTAVVSASFATYMVSTDHPHPTFGGIEHLMIFAQPSLGYPRAAIATVEGTRLSDRESIMAPPVRFHRNRRPRPEFLQAISPSRSSALICCMTCMTVRQSSLERMITSIRSSAARFYQASGAFWRSASAAANGLS
jgi:hypothetical protein